MPSIALFTLFLLSAVVTAAGPEEHVNQEIFEFAFMIFEEFRITPEIGVVYPPILMNASTPLTANN